MAKTNKINIMQVVLKLNVGGLERVVIDLLKNLDPNTYNPILCCLENYGSMIHEVKKLGIETIALGKKEEGLDLLLIPRLLKALKQYEVKILHSHNSSPHLYSTIAGKLASTPINIYTIHGQVSAIHGQGLYMKHRPLLYMTDMIVAVSHDARKMILNGSKISHNKVVTILNGIDEEKYSARVNIIDKKRSIGLSTEDLVIGIVARLAPEKDHNTLLDAFRLVLNNTHLNIKLVIVGDGSLKEQMIKKSQLLSIDKNVIFLGERHDVPELLATFNLFVLSSTTEGISLTLLEAMAAGLPVIATKVGGNPEIVMDKQTGLIVPPRDPISMAKAISHIIDNPYIWKQMGMKGKERVSNVFSVKTMVNEYQKVYEKIMIQKGVKFAR